MRAAERNGTLTREQYSSCINHTSIEQGLNKKLTLDILQQKKKPGALLSNDAKACYNQIIHSIASITL